MNENFNKSATKKIRSSTSSMNFNSQNSQLIFVKLVNNLNSQIRKFYHSTKLCLSQGKQNNNKNNFTSLQTYDLINNYLEEFISKAKDIFKRMKYMQKINLIQQEINNNQNIDNFNEKTIYGNKIMNKKKIIDEEINVPSLFNSTSNSFNINQYFSKINPEKNKNLIDKNRRNDIKSLSNSSKDIKLINKYNNTFNNEEKRKNHHSTNQIIYNNCNRKCNNLKRNSNIKSIINLRKKFIFDKRPENSSLALSNSNGLNNINSNFNSNNNSRNNLFQPKKEIFENLNAIISLLKELKSIKGDIFTKSIEAEKHQKVVKKIYNELLILIKNIFKENNININNSSEIFDKYDKLRNNNNNNFNLTYNYKIFNNNENNNKNINYKKEIKHRDLIIQQLKNELNIQSQKKFSKKNLNINDNNNNSYQEENENKNKTKKIINELQEKIDKNQKKNIVYPKLDKNIEIIKQKCNELEKEKENILLNNEELKNQINLLNQELDIVKKNICINPMFKDLISQKFSFNYSAIDTIGEQAKKIIEKLNEGINTYKEENNKLKEKIINLNDDMNKYKEELEKLNEDNKKYTEENSQLNQKYNEINVENKKSKENIDELNKNIEKYKKIISYQEEEIKNLKSNTQLQNQNDKEILNKSLPLKESLINSNIVFTEENKYKKRNNAKINEYQMEQDKIYLKYELLKNDYDKLNTTLIQKQKLLDNYSKISSETASKTNIDEQILELMAEHKKEIENLTEKYNKNIMNLKMNLPSPYSPATHTILIDKRYGKYDLKWYLLTVLTENEKNYENTFWVSDMEMKPILDQFNKYKTEKELEDEKFDNLYKMQEKWIKQLDEKEKIIEEMRDKLDFYENSHSGN